MVVHLELAGKKAWMLIKESGCHNFSEGNASISEKHCNFLLITVKQLPKILNFN